MTHPTPSPPPRAVRDLRTDGRHAPAPDRGGRSRVEPAGCDGAFERAWLAELSHRTVGARLASVGRRDLRLQFVCTTPDRVLPWRVHVVDGTLVSVGAGFTLDPERAVNHSLALGLRLLGATGTGPIDVDDLCVDC